MKCPIRPNLALGNLGFPLGWGRLLPPSLFFAIAIYYEELVLKLYCFGAVSLTGALFTLLFTLPIALLLGLLCGSVPPRFGRILLPLCMGLISLWMGSQAVYYSMFKTFLTLFSLTKLTMVAGAFGEMATGEIFLNWIPIVLMAIPPFSGVLLSRKALVDAPSVEGVRLQWASMAAALQLLIMGLVLLSSGGVLSLRYIYTQAATPELEVKSFGLLTQTQLELRRVLFGIDPDSDYRLVKYLLPMPQDPDNVPSTPLPTATGYHMMDIDFEALGAQEQDETLLAAHSWFSQRNPTPKNDWTGYFQGKNLVWIVAESFSSLALDPQRTPTLWKLSHEGFVFDHFYTPLWGVSTSDGEYVTTTGIIPKSGIWSYSQSAENAMPFALGTQFQKQGYRTMAFHNYLYDYYDRNLSHPNMGYEYYAMGQGLTPEELIPPENLAAGALFPPSDRMMMDAIAPMFVNEEQFMVYCLTVSGHLNYNLEENIMAARHWNQVSQLPYDDAVKCYLSTQMELELAVTALIEQLTAAGKLEDTVIVLSADHYPYGLNDEEYSQLLGHPVDPVFELFENTLMIWNAEMEQPVYVDKYCSSLDVLPTLANLFNLEYDSRLLMGQDILSENNALVIFSNYSFITSEGAYNSVTDQFMRWDGQEADLAMVASTIAEVQNRVAYSAVILDYDYYRLALHGPQKEKEAIFPFPLIPPWDSESRPEYNRRP